MELQDMVYHYGQRLNMALSELEDCRKSLVKLEHEAEENWQGPACESFAAKLIECETHRKKAEDELSAAFYAIKQLAAELAEEEELI